MGSRVIAAVLLMASLAAAKPDDDDRPWQDAFAARERFYREHLGPLPKEILKMNNLFGVWPGGGLCVLKADKLKGVWITSTFGLTNPDMPTDVRSEGNVGLFERIEEVGGVTLERVHVRDDRTVNVLVAPAAAPLPVEMRLPNGKARLFVATVITEPEMRFAMKNGNPALLKLLLGSPVKQKSILGRASLVQKPDCHHECRELFDSHQLNPGTTLKACEKMLCK